MSVEVLAKPGTNTNPDHPTEWRQATNLQHQLVADALNPATPPAVRAQLAAAFVTLGNHKRILRMKPAPKAIDTTKLPAKRKREPKPINPPE